MSEACWCGEPAVRRCGYARMNMVCGRPLCEDHECKIGGHYG